MRTWGKREIRWVTGSQISTGVVSYVAAEPTYEKSLNVERKLYIKRGQLTQIIYEHSRTLHEGIDGVLLQFRFRRQLHQSQLYKRQNKLCEQTADLAIRVTNAFGS